MLKGLCNAVALAMLCAAPLEAAQPTEAQTREAVAALVAQRHEGRPNGWPLLVEAINASEAARREVTDRWEEQGAGRPNPVDDAELIILGDWPRPGIDPRLIAATRANGALGKLGALAELGQAWPPVDEFPATTIEAVSWYTPLLMLCRARRAAMRMDASDGDLEGAVAGARDLLVAGRIGADQLLLRHRRHGVVFTILALSEIRHQVVEGLYDAKTCRELIGVIDREFDWPSMELALEAERRLALDDYARDGGADLVLRLDEALREVHDAALREMAPGPALETGNASIDELVEFELLRLSGALTNDRFVRTVADATRIMLALEIYRAERGAYPADLAALAPGWLPGIPNDRISGQALRYEKLDDDDAAHGYLLYSVGLDGQDDGGATHEYGPAAAAIGKVRPGFDFVLNHPRAAPPEE